MKREDIAKVVKVVEKITALENINANLSQSKEIYLLVNGKGMAIDMPLKLIIVDYITTKNQKEIDKLNNDLNAF